MAELDDLKQRIADRFEVYELLDYMEITVEEFVDSYIDRLIDNRDFLMEMGEVIDDEDSECEERDFDLEGYVD